MAAGAGVRVGGISKFIPNPAGLIAIGISPQMQAMLLAKAQVVAEVAKNLAPVGASGAYQAGIEAVVGVSRERGIPTAVGRVNAMDFKSNWIEFGTGAPGPTPAFACLRRALETAG